MSIIFHDPATEPGIFSDQENAAVIDASLGRWVAGARYPGGTEIWCADHGGEAAWTTDRKLAATFPSEFTAAMRARLLADGGALPFWTSDEA
jgi:hypothetical protein